MTDIGYALSSEEHPPADLVANAERAEAAGFDFAMLSDHFHPWIDRQGEAGFAWATLGALAQATERLRVGTGVTCPTMRMHPAIIAQAAATAGTLFDGRFFLGVGTGERLNEHVTGDRWPPHGKRLSMLAEAVSIVRDLWSGEVTSHHGEHYTVEDARLYTLPDEPPDVTVAAGGETTARAAASFGDALIGTSPESDVVDAYRDASDGDAPRYGQVTVCWAETEREAREVAHEWWPNTALPGELGQELATPTHFEQAVQLVSEEDVAEKVTCSPDPDDHVEAVQAFVDAGYDHVYVHQVGPDQEEFLSVYEESVLPSFS